MERKHRCTWEPLLERAVLASEASPSSGALWIEGAFLLLLAVPVDTQDARLRSCFILIGAGGTSNSVSDTVLGPMYLTLYKRAASLRDRNSSLIKELENENEKEKGRTHRGIRVSNLRRCLPSFPFLRNERKGELHDNRPAHLEQLDVSLLPLDPRLSAFHDGTLLKMRRPVNNESIKRME
jgi:hypothetical protein